MTLGRKRGSGTSIVVSLKAGVRKPPSQPGGSVSCSPPQLFTGWRVHLPRGLTPEKQRKGLEELVVAHGGGVEQKLSGAVTHVLMELEPTDPHLLARLTALKAEKPEAVLAKPNWLATCAVHKVVRAPVGQELITLGFSQQPASQPPSQQPVVVAASVAEDVPGGVAVISRGKMNKREREILLGGSAATASGDETEDDVSDAEPDDGPADDVGGYRAHLACQPAQARYGAEVNGDLISTLKELAATYTALRDFDSENFRRAWAFNGLANKCMKAVRFQINSPAAAQRAICRLHLGANTKSAVLLADYGRRVMGKPFACARLDTLQADAQVTAVSELSQVWGIGCNAALRLVRKGIMSIAQLRARVASDVANGRPNATLDARERMCLGCMEDMQKPIPRDEVSTIFATVFAELQLLCPGAEAHVAGSYRRGKDFSNDVDILMTHRDEEMARDLLDRLVCRLQERGLLPGILSCSMDKNQDIQMCFVLWREPETPGQPRRLTRRVDLKVYPAKFFAYALLYFTGNAHFNRSMRYYAKRRGWSLSDKGLVNAVRGPNGESIKATDGVKADSEADIFAAMGLDYVPPDKRSV